MKLFEELELPNRRRIKEGDIFACRIDGRYYYVRLMRTDVNYLGPGKAMLYMFKASSDEMLPIPELRKEELLIPPVLIIPQSVKDGFSVRIESRELQPGDRYERHCFSTLIGGPGSFEDEFGVRHAEMFEPCGRGILHLGFLSLENEIARALSICESYEELDELKDLPRPLLKALRATQPTRPYVCLVIPQFEQLILPQLIDRFSRDPGWLQTTANTFDGSDLTVSRVCGKFEKTIQKMPGFSGTAIQEYKFIERGPKEWQFAFTIKRKQHKEFYELIRQAMRSLEVDDYWIEDAELGQWLYGPGRREGTAPES